MKMNHSILGKHDARYIFQKVMVTEPCIYHVGNDSITT